MSAVRTALGDVPAGELGVCDAHDHLFFAGPRLPGEELHDTAAARAEPAAWREWGGGAVVRWTPYGLRRRAAGLPACPGRPVCMWSPRRGSTGTPLRRGVLAGPRGRAADVFAAELTRGTGTSGVRAGLIKVAGGFHERLDALGRAVHDALVETLGIPPDDRFQVLTAHDAARSTLRHGDCLGVHRDEDIVFVAITLRAGRTTGRKQALYRRIAQLAEEYAGTAPTSSSP